MTLGLVEEAAYRCVRRETRGCSMHDLKRELSALEHGLVQLERGDLHKQGIGPKNVDVLAAVKAGYKRRIAGLKQRLA